MDYALELRVVYHQQINYGYVCAVTRCVCNYKLCLKTLD